MSLTLVALAGGIGGLMLVAAAGMLYRSGAPLPLALGAFGLGGLLGAIAVISALAALVIGMRRGQPTSYMVLTGLVLGLLAFGFPFQRAWSARGLPAIHDISTDLTDPPVFDAILPLRRDAPNSVEFSQETAAAQRRAYPDIRPLVLAQPAGDVFARALDTAREMDWEVVAADRAAGRIEATAVTRWFGFRDDVVVRLTPAASGGTRVDVRSVSRVGVGDLGTNANRVREFLDRLAGR